MISLGSLISKNSDDFSMQVTAAWEEIVNSPMILRDENGEVIRLRKDELIQGVDY